MRQRSRCHRFGALLRWEIRFLSWIRVRGYDYSRVTRVRVLLTFFTTSLRYLRILASLGVTWCDPPYFLAYPHVFIGFLGFFRVGQSYSCVDVDRHDGYSADSSAGLAQCGFVGGFIPNFAIFALVSDHLRNFCFIPGIPFWCCLLFSACLSSSLSLSLLWWLAWGSQLQPTFYGGPCCVALGEFLSVAAVLYLLLPTPATGFVSSCWASLVCLFSWSWYTWGFSTRCHVAGCLFGVPLLAVPLRVAGRTGSAPLPPLDLVVFSASGVLGVGGVGPPSSGPSGFRRWEPSPFRPLSGGCLSLHWQAWRDRGAEPWVVEVLRVGYCLPFLSTPPLSDVPIPMPSSSPTSIKGAALEEVTLGFIARGAVELIHSLLQTSTPVCS